jgi:MOSC domain-containing protein YiiM
MKLLSVNVSLPKEVVYNGEPVRTGIFKQPVRGRVQLRRLNLDGDRQGDPEVHGGEDKAVYVYTVEHYDHWKQALGREFPYGWFGEKFTVEGMPDDAVHIGDVFRVGDALVEVTQPRVPCFKLGIIMNMDSFPKMFLASGRLGFYLRVLEEGGVEAGDIIERVRIGPERMAVRQVAQLLYSDRGNLEAARRTLRIPALSAAWRESFEELIGKGGTGSTTPTDTEM